MAVPEKKILEHFSSLPHSIAGVARLPCQTQLVTVSSRMNPPQDTAEPISQAGVTSVKTLFKKEQNTAQRGRSEKKKKCKKLVNNKVREEGGVGGIPAIPLQAMLKQTLLTGTVAHGGLC